MRESVQTKLIPEHVVTIVKYIAFDGQEFAFKDQCEAHEKQLLREAEIESHPVIKTAREVELYPDMNSATLYYIPSDEEYEFLMNYLKPGKAYQDDYKKFGPGFYIYIWEDGGDGPSDYYRLLEVNKYMDLLELELKNFKYEVEELIDDIKYDLSEPEDPDSESL